MKWTLTSAIIHISLNNDEVEPLFMFLGPFGVLLNMICLFIPFARFSIGLSFFLLSWSSTGTLILCQLYVP